MAGICTSPYPSPYPIEKVGDYPNPYPINAGIPRQNGDGFGQYPRGRVYLPSLIRGYWSLKICYLDFGYQNDLVSKLVSN